MTRTDNIKKNLIFNLIKFATQLVLQFVLRTVLVSVFAPYGAEYLGLSGLFTNIFAFLNLAELGIGSAIVFSMYKPIAENDIEKVKTLQNLYKKFYLIISLIVFIIGLIILPFLRHLINGDVQININIFILYLMYLVNTIVGYFSAHKRSLLFAYQRNDVENKARTLCLFGMTIIQIIVLYLFKNYYIFFAVNILFTIVECVLIHAWANKLYPEINGKSSILDKETKKEITKNVTALSMHKVGSVVIGATDSLIISAFIGLGILGIYQNYILVTTSLMAVFALIVNALTGSVGNLVASREKTYVYEKYKQINFIFSYLAGFSTICLVVLFQPFMSIWMENVGTLEFSTVILISISFYLGRMRTGTSVFKDATGIFWQDRWKPIAEALVNLVVSILLVYFFGIDGVFIGTIISTLVAPMWVEPYVLYKHYFKRSVWEYFRRYILDVIIMIVCAVICYFVCSLIPDGNIWLLIAKFVACIVLSNLLLIGIYCRTKEFKELWSMGKEMIKKFFNRKKVEQSENI